MLVFIFYTLEFLHIFANPVPWNAISFSIIYISLISSISMAFSYVSWLARFHIIENASKEKHPCWIDMTSKSCSLLWRTGSYTGNNLLSTNKCMASTVFIAILHMNSGLWTFSCCKLSQNYSTSVKICIAQTGCTHEQTNI